MASHSSAPTREQAPHTTKPTQPTDVTQATRTTRTATIVNAFTRRILAVLTDRSIDAQDRALIRYALEINDPWLAELVRRVENGQRVADAITQLARDFAQC